MSSPAPNPFDTMMSFSKLMPGFEFLQGWAHSADKAMPPLGPWVTPTLDPQELDKRINDLKAVQFWLDQNGRMLASTIQALEVQKMTLVTLASMNVSMSDLKASMHMPPMSGVGASAPPSPADADEPAASQAPQTPETSAEASVKPALDAMKMWGALSQQFAQMASSTLGEPFAPATVKAAPGSGRATSGGAASAPGTPSQRTDQGRAGSGTTGSASVSKKTGTAPGVPKAAAPKRTGGPLPRSRGG